IDAAPQRCKRGPSLGVIDGQIAAAMEIVSSRHRPARGVDAVERCQKLAESPGELIEIGNVLPGSRDASTPAIDGPWPWISEARPALGDRCGDRQRQVRRELGKPAMLFLDLGDIPCRAWQTNGHDVAQPESAIIPPAGLKGLDSQAGPFRELRSNQATDELGVSGPRACRVRD